MTSLIFVGESPPLGAAPDFNPFDCASGTRLAKIMLGLRDREVLLQHTTRSNIFDTPTGVKGAADPWVPEVARARGAIMTLPAMTIALGRRTAEALGMPDVPATASFNWAPPLLTTWQRGTGLVMYAPHLLGASSVLNDALVRTEVRAALIPELVIGCPSLRPWHFRLDEPDVLAGLAAAVAPAWPSIGAAALTWADSMHKAQHAHDMLTLYVPREYDPEQTWDVPLRVIAQLLSRTGGAAVLSALWTSGRNTTFLAKEAKRSYVALNERRSLTTMRATQARYLAAGLT